MDNNAASARAGGYSVKINGREMALETARVSAVPFNRRWPGHQRSADQTEEAFFLLTETDGPLSFEITPDAPFERVAVRPRSLGVEPEITADGRIRFTLPGPAYFTVEPYGRHRALHVFVDEKKDYDAEPGEKDVLYFGPGENDAGLIRLRSNQTLFLDAGAVVYGGVVADDAENIRILGRGILDNSRNRAQILYEVSAENNDAAVENAVRVHTIQLNYCTNVVVDGITIRDSLVYNIRPVGCRNLRISDVKIIGCWRYNSDGIDMHNCENVLVDHCFIRTFDDCLCVKGFDCFYEADPAAATERAINHGGGRYDVFRNVCVRRCLLWNDWGKCLEIGAETRAREISNIVFEECSVLHADTAVLDCLNVDNADVHDVVFREIDVELDDVFPEPRIQHSDAEVYRSVRDDHCPTLLQACVMYHPEYSVGSAERGRIRRVTFENIRCWGRHRPVFRFAGLDAEHRVSDVAVRGFQLNGQTLREGDFDIAQNEYCDAVVVEVQ